MQQFNTKLSKQKFAKLYTFCLDQERCANTRLISYSSVWMTLTEETVTERLRLYSDSLAARVMVLPIEYSSYNSICRSRNITKFSILQLYCVAVFIDISILPSQFSSSKTVITIVLCGERACKRMLKLEDLCWPLCMCLLHRYQLNVTWMFN